MVISYFRVEKGPALTKANTGIKRFLIWDIIRLERPCRCPTTGRTTVPQRRRLLPTAAGDSRQEIQQARFLFQRNERPNARTVYKCHGLAIVRVCPQTAKSGLPGIAFPDGPIVSSQLASRLQCFLAVACSAALPFSYEISSAWMLWS